MISDENERIRETKRTEADREGDLRSLVDDAVVEFSAREDGAEKNEKSQRRERTMRRERGVRIHWSIVKAVVATT